MVGFKSFAEKTRLEFEPGLTAVVGPNGCGKSNVSDAIRWVLGEQSAKAMRGAKMEDVIFTGTDALKALGMAEVSITVADCEKTLGTEFNEVTVTRRVFRSGEGQYFINKAPCRLRDIQRLFMDTGIGTDSYSIMEQGRIDRILSSRPDDRREVFEEASGITKFKADKREALRKLEQTEANLLRLADIIREVKRQIISLQRQAGKARRYQVLHDQLRAFDLFATRERLEQLDRELATLEARLASATEQEEALADGIGERETAVAAVRAAIDGLDAAAAEATERAMQARNDLGRLQDLLRTNQDRVRELRQLAERDSRDADESRGRLATHTASRGEAAADLERARREQTAAEADLAAHQQRLEAAERAHAVAGDDVHRLQSEQVELELRVSELQQELTDLDAEDRTNLARRERLRAEHEELQRTRQVQEGRLGDVLRRAEGLAGDVARAQEQLGVLSGQQADRHQAVADLDQQLAALRVDAARRHAQIEMLETMRAGREGFPEGARRLLEDPAALGASAADVLGPLAELLEVDPPHRRALEAALRPWADAVVVRRAGTASAALSALEQLMAGSARLLFPGAAAPAADAGGPDRLADLVRCPDEARPVVARLLGHVRVVARVSDIPDPVPAGEIYVTAGGALIAGDGRAEFWKPEDDHANPLAREQTLVLWRRELGEVQLRLEAVRASRDAVAAEEGSVASAAAAARDAHDARRREAAAVEGERQIIAGQAREAAERVETVAWELRSLVDQHRAGDERRGAIVSALEDTRARQSAVRTTLSARLEALRNLEQQRGRALEEAAERRVKFAECRQRAEAHAARLEQLQARIAELEALIGERARGVVRYEERIAELEAAAAAATERVLPLRQDAEFLEARTAAARREREERVRDLGAAEQALREQRSALDDLRRRKGQTEVELAEQRLRRQNTFDRAAADYRVTAADIAAAAEPAWEGGLRPDRDTLEALMAELRAKIEAMGPVNLVAIEEHRELEERHAFLTTQQADLTAAKQQLMDLIRQINRTTTEMFAETFAKVNTNFQAMFTQLFGGGQARLVLLDEGDVLESGIEIIARPPGKKLQTVSLLSGGERTMTAVALLFSLFMVRPSPFCVLDELDAALDDANIGRFVRTVQGFLESSQFVVITHNRQTIAAARCLYGVTMEQQGVSKIVSVRFNDSVAPAPAAATVTTPAAAPG